MATIKYLLQSKGENAQIYLRLSLGREKATNKDDKPKFISYKQKTGFTINSKGWSDATGLPIPKKDDTTIQNLTADLRTLTKYVLDELNKSSSKGIEVNSRWLKETISKCFDRVELTELEYLNNYGEFFLKQLKYKGSNNKIGVSRSTEKKYTTIVKKINSFSTYKKTKYKIVDVDLKFRNEFIKYLSEHDKLMDNTIGRYLKVVKTICLDAQKNDYETNKQLKHFQGFTVKAPKIVLSFDELEQIKRKELVNNMHEIARDWLIIGCYTGQRVSDLMRMNSSFIDRIHNFDFIVLEQIKTGKIVQIPVHNEVKQILDKRNGEFPPLFNHSMESNNVLFNRYLKQLCKIAEIENIVEGNYFDELKGRTITGLTEKHNLISSHICRRSFATNFYSDRKYPTPLLMNITAHSTEKMFLEYIGKKPIDYGLQLAGIWSTEALKEKKEPNLTVVKDAANSN